MENAAERFEEGSANARQSAKNAAGSTQRVLKVGLYNAAYGVSYGVVFATVFLTELLPKDGILRRGLEEGADAAFDAQAKLKKNSEAAPEAEAPKRSKPKSSAAKKKTASRSAKASA